MAEERKIFPVIGLAVLLLACEPSSKEAYLHNFENFVERVGKCRADYTKKDWEWADLRFQKYSEEWFGKFENKLTVNEEIKIFELKQEYTSFKSKNDLRKIRRRYERKDLDGTKRKLDDYIEKDLDEDLEKIIEGAAEIGDSVVKVLDEVIERIKNRF